jgi:hypothetical protein
VTEKLPRLQQQVVITALMKASADFSEMARILTLRYWQMCRDIEKDGVILNACIYTLR